MEQIIIENIPISFSRKNIKNINIRITRPNGEVKVSAPYLISKRKVEKFVISKKDWILKSQKAVIERSKNKNDRMENLIAKKMRESSMTLKQAKKWFENELLNLSKPVFDKWERQTGLKPKIVVVRWPKTLWGTCDKANKKIMLNASLISMDKKYLDYVVLHELTHLKYANHGSDFKNFMTKYMPDWKDIRKQLNE